MKSKHLLHIYHRYISILLNDQQSLLYVYTYILFQLFYSFKKNLFSRHFLLLLFSFCFLFLFLYQFHRKSHDNVNEKSNENHTRCHDFDVAVVRRKSQETSSLTFFQKLKTFVRPRASKTTLVSTMLLSLSTIFLATVQTRVNARTRCSVRGEEEHHSTAYSIFELKYV